MGKKKLKKVESISESSELVNKTAMEIRKAIFKVTKDIDRMEAWVIAARALNAVFQSFYNQSLKTAEDALKDLKDSK